MTRPETGTFLPKCRRPHVSFWFCGERHEVSAAAENIGFHGSGTIICFRGSTVEFIPRPFQASSKTSTKEVKRVLPWKAGGSTHHNFTHQIPQGLHGSDDNFRRSDGSFHGSGGQLHGSNYCIFQVRRSWSLPWKQKVASVEVTEHVE